MKLSKRKIDQLCTMFWGRSPNCKGAEIKHRDAAIFACLVNHDSGFIESDTDDHRVKITVFGEGLDKAEITVSLPDAQNLAVNIDRMSWASIGEDVLREAMKHKTYTITKPQIAELADAIALLDWIKNRVPDEIPEKAEAAVKSVRCRALLEALLYDDAPSVYATEEEIAP